MTPKHRSYLAGTLGILLGVFILFIGYRTVRSELSLGKYKKAFLQVDHPQGTARIDSFGLEVSYYPATYVDDSIKFKSAYLVGELRGYTGDWQAIHAFYSDTILENGEVKPLQVAVLPVEIQSDGQKPFLKFPNDFSYDPFAYVVLEELQSHYKSQEMPQEEAGRKFYLIYVAPDM